MTDCPCYGCADRSATCHSICEKYIDWSKRFKAKHEKAKLNADFIGYQQERFTENIRKTRGRLKRKR